MEQTQILAQAREILLGSDLLSGRGNIGGSVDNVLFAAALLVAPRAAELSQVEIAEKVWTTAEALIVAGLTRKAAV